MSQFELEQLGRAVGGKAEVEAVVVQRWRLGLPRAPDRVVRPFRDAEPLKPIALVRNKRLAGAQEQRVQLGRGGFDRLDFRHGAAVASALHPVRLVVDRVPGQPVGLHLGLPVRPLWDRQALHSPKPPCDPPNERADEPRPPREIAALRVIEVEAGA